MNRFNLTLGLSMAALFTAFIMLLPHKTFRVQGTESDLGYFYVPMARTLATNLLGEEAYTDREYTWQFHGPVYPLMLLAGRKAIGPDTDRGYFVWAKWLSALAGGLIILLAFLWLGVPEAFLASLCLALSYVFVECSFSCGTDLLAITMLLWAAFILRSTKPSRWKLLIAGLLLAFCVDMRHEFIVLAPFALFYLWKRNKTADEYLTAGRKRAWYSLKNPYSLLLFLIPFVLIVLPDMPGWNGSYNAAFKYKADDARWQDLWPAEAFTEEATDDVTETYWGYLIRKTDEKYPSLLSVLLDDPVNNAKIWIRDIARGLKDIPAVWTLPFLSIALVFFIARSGVLKPWGTFGRIAFWAVAFHFMMISSFGVYMDRYYLLEMTALTFAGSIAFFKLIPAGKKGYLTLLITLPFFYLGGVETGKVIDRNIGLNGDRFLRYREIVQPEAGKDHALMMSRGPGIPFNAGAEWFQFPKGVSDLHTYCLDRGIRYIRWGSKESAFRSEYSPIFDYPDKVEPYYTEIDRKSGFLYYVNEVEGKP